MQENDNWRAATFFDSHAEEYEAVHYGARRHSFMTVRQRSVLEFVDRIGLGTGANVLDAGCGPGHLLAALAARGFRARGLDASPAMVSVARARVTASGFSDLPDVTLGDIENMPFEAAAFDLVCSTGVIEYLQDDSAVLSEFFRVLRPGGYLVLPVTNIWSPINYLEPFLERMKRATWIRRPISALWKRLGRGPVLPRHFRVRRHRPARLRASLSKAGFELERDAYFFFMPWPRPFDRVFPRLTERIGPRMERLARSRLAPLAEGYLTLSRKVACPDSVRDRATRPEGLTA
jgi:ubiquinone/menaquinone biosynthesis C-methylase UbiE